MPTTRRPSSGRAAGCDGGRDCRWEADLRRFGGVIPELEATLEIRNECLETDDNSPTQKSGSDFDEPSTDGSSDPTPVIPLRTQLPPVAKRKQTPADDPQEDPAAKLARRVEAASRGITGGR